MIYIRITNVALMRSFTRLFGSLSAVEREKVNSEILAVGDGSLESAHCPYMFYGRFVHELIFEPKKLRPLCSGERVGALVSALMICILAAEGKVPLADRSLKRSPQIILQRAREHGYFSQVSAFICKLNELEDEEDPREEIRKLERELSSIRKALRYERDLDRVIRVETVRSETIFELESLSESAKWEFSFCKNRKLRKQLSDLQFGIEQLKRQIQRSNARAFCGFSLIPDPV